ncbi:MAG: trimethylamine methyltransferase family protein [Synergistaceae bacterium]|nr:trimethylamine methyltransferase family protein [Synergistaceae bacterium]
MVFKSPSYKLSILGKEGCSRVDKVVLRIMHEIGMIIDNKKARERLFDAGAKDMGGNKVSISHDLIDKSLETAPSTFKLYSVNGKEAMDINKENMYFGVSTSSLGFIDPWEGRKVAHTKRTSSYMAMVADALPNIDYVGNGGLLSDVDPRIGGRINFTNTLRYTTKPMYICPDYAASYIDAIALAQDISGGAQKLKDKPFIFGYCEPVPPLYHSNDAIEKLIICGDSGIPVVYMPYCMRGGTAGIFLAAALAQNYAEILTGLVIHQLFNPGAVFIAGSMPTILDMKTTTGSYGAPEFHFGIAASSEMCDYYNLPFFGTAGCTDSQQLDMQASTEVTMGILSTLLTGADVVHDTGVMQHASALSPEILVYTNEILDMLRVYQEGIDLSDESFIFDVIKRVGPRGHYLEEETTLRNFKKIWYSKVFDRSLNSEIPQNNFANKIKEKTKSIIATHINDSVNENIIPILEEHERKWFVNL